MIRYKKWETIEASYEWDYWKKAIYICKANRILYYVREYYGSIEEIYTIRYIKKLIK